MWQPTQQSAVGDSLQQIEQFIDDRFTHELFLLHDQLKTIDSELNSYRESLYRLDASTLRHVNDLVTLKSKKFHQFEQKKEEYIAFLKMSESFIMTAALSWLDSRIRMQQ